MVGLSELRFCPDVDRGTAHLMVGSLVRVEVIAGKVHQKNFPIAARYSDGSGRFM